ncbi:MAG: hypothetical protein RH859_08030 [Longimicrobiales bacterium]
MKKSTDQFRRVTAVVLAVVLPASGPRSALGQVIGTELTAAVNLDASDAWVSGELFIADGIDEARCVMVVVDWGLGAGLYHNQELRQTVGSVGCGLLLLRMRFIRTRTANAGQIVRDAALGGSEGLGILAEDFARAFGRPELATAPFLFWGHSAAGTFGLTYAGLHPDRTIAFVRHNSHLRDLPVDMGVLTGIPGLMIVGEDDQVAGTEDARGLWAAGRADQAPWAIAVQPGAPHNSARHLVEANALLLPWVAAVVELRLGSGDSGLRPVSVARGWIAGEGAREPMPAGLYSGAPHQASWLPDEATARGWQRVTGN